MKKLFLFFSILTIAFGCFFIAQAQQTFHGLSYRGVDTNRILMTFNKSVDLNKSEGEAAAIKILKDAGVKDIVFIKKQNLAIATITDFSVADSPETFEKARQVIERLNNGKFGVAQFNFAYSTTGNESPTFKPSDPNYPSQNDLFVKFYINDKSIGFSAPEAWNFTERKVYEGRGVYKDKYTQDVIVAVVDTGLTDNAYRNPDIANILWKEKDLSCLDYNFQKIKCPNGGIDINKYFYNVSPSVAYSDKFTDGLHGEAIAKIIASLMENGNDMAGINNVQSSKEQYVRIMPVKVIYEKPTPGRSDTERITSAEIVAGIHFAKNNRANLINLSLMRSDASIGDDLAVLEAVKQAGEMGIFTITADEKICQSPNVTYYGQRVNPVVCVGGYELPGMDGKSPDIKVNRASGVLDLKVNLAPGDTMPVRNLPSIEAYNSSAVDITAPNWVSFGEVKRGISYAIAHITGAMAHVLRFGIAPKTDMALQRCIIENIGDDFLDGGLYSISGHVFKTVNLAKIAQFSGNLAKCQSIAASRVSLPAPKLEIQNVKLLKHYTDSLKNEYFDLAVDVAVPKDYDRSFEYIVRNNQTDGIDPVFGVNSAANILANNKDGIFTVKTTYLMRASSAQDGPAYRKNLDYLYLCFNVLARNPDSLNIYESKKWCASGTKLFSFGDDLSFSIYRDGDYAHSVLNTKDEVDDQLNINVSGGSVSETYDIEAKVERKFFCPDQFAQSLSKIESKYLDNAFSPPIIKMFSNVKFTKSPYGGTFWNDNIKIPRNLLTWYDITLTVFSNSKVVGQVKKEIYPTEGFICIGGASIWRSTKDSADVALFGTFFLGREELASGKPTMLSVWRRGANLLEALVDGGDIPLTRSPDHTERNIWIASDFKLGDFAPNQSHGFQLHFRLTKDEIKQLQDKVFLDGTGGDRSGIAFSNVGGARFVMPFYSGLPGIDLKMFDDPEDNTSSNKKELQLTLPTKINETLSKLKSPLVDTTNKTTATSKTLSNNLCSGVQATGDKKCFQGVWVERVSGRNCGQYLARDILNTKNQAKSFFSFASFEDAEEKIATMVRIGLITPKTCPAECPEDSGANDR